MGANTGWIMLNGALTVSQNVDHFFQTNHALPGTVIFEINGLDKEMSYKVLKTASYKLPIKTKIIEREIIRI